MLQQLLLLLYLMAMEIQSICGSSCSVTRVIMRVPREHDIGLIFDLTVSNRRNVKSEILEFIISSEGACTLNLTNGEQIEAGTIFGGNFGYIQPGLSITVSLVWPTVSVYNRVGSCPIIVSTINHRNEEIKTDQILYFDTRFETLDPSNHSLRRRKDFIDCKNWDKNYFMNCTPLNCEELYFGKRSFYNRTTEQCEPVPRCSGEGIRYDFYANECFDMINFITEEEIEQLKQGKFDDNYLELDDYGTSSQSEPEIPKTEKKEDEDNKRQPRQMGRECNFNQKLSLFDFNNCFQHLNDPQLISDPTIKTEIATACPSNMNKKLKKKSTASSMLKEFYYDWYMPLRDRSESDDETDNDNDNDNNNDNDNDTETKSAKSDHSKSASNSLVDRLSDLNSLEWITLIMDMLLIISLIIVFQIIATIFTYALVCLILYGIMELLAKLAPYKVTSTHIGKKLTPKYLKKQDRGVMTSASLMSIQR